jgi:hypothetical protein
VIHLISSKLERRVQNQIQEPSFASLSKISNQRNDRYIGEFKKKTKNDSIEKEGDIKNSVLTRF